MRLAQLARKVKVSSTDVMRFLEAEFEITIGKDPNFKLDQDHIEAVVAAFPIPVENTEIVEKKKTEVNPEPEEQELTPSTDNNEAEIVVETEMENTEAESIVEDITLQEEAQDEEEPADDDKVEITQEAITEQEKKVETVAEVKTPVESLGDTSKVQINYDSESEAPKEDEKNELFEEVPVDRNAPIIEAEKVKLDGLKILGKIELPSNKKEEVIEETEEVIAQKEQDEIAALDAAMASNAQDIKAASVKPALDSAVKEHLDTDKEEVQSPYKDNKGIYHFSPQQRENRKKRLAQLEEKKEQQRRRESKKRHYEEMMASKKQAPSKKMEKRKEKKTEATKKRKVELQQKAKPKGIWQRFKAWLND